MTLIVKLSSLLLCSICGLSINHPRKEERIYSFTHSRNIYVAPDCYQTGSMGVEGGEIDNGPSLWRLPSCGGRTKIKQRIEQDNFR